jgi:predicted nucleic acid-binding protein
MSGILVDTNILLYAYRPKEEDHRSDAARRDLAARFIAGDGYVSVQNLAELSVVCLTKLKPALDMKTLQEILDSVEQGLTVLRPSSDTVRTALRGVSDHGLSFWDAMLWAVAVEHHLSEIHSADFQDGRILGGVRFRNPLH